jgi:hypothetical protein
MPVDACRAAIDRFAGACRAENCIPRRLVRSGYGPRGPDVDVYVVSYEAD